MVFDPLAFISKGASAGHMVGGTLWSVKEQICNCDRWNSKWGDWMNARSNIRLWAKQSKKNTSSALGRRRGETLARAMGESSSFFISLSSLTQGCNDTTRNFLVTPFYLSQLNLSHFVHWLETNRDYCLLSVGIFLVKVVVIGIQVEVTI